MKSKGSELANIRVMLGKLLGIPIRDFIGGEIIDASTARAGAWQDVLTAGSPIHWIRWAGMSPPRLGDPLDRAHERSFSAAPTALSSHNA